MRFFSRARTRADTCARECVRARLRARIVCIVGLARPAHRRAPKEGRPAPHGGLLPTLRPRARVNFSRTSARGALLFRDPCNAANSMLSVASCRKSSAYRRPILRTDPPPLSIPAPHGNRVFYYRLRNLHFYKFFVSIDEQRSVKKEKREREIFPQQNG